MADKNKISAILSDADRIAIINFLQSIKALLPFLIALTERDRKTLRKMGAKSVQYVNLNLQGKSQVNCSALHLSFLSCEEKRW